LCIVKKYIMAKAKRVKGVKIYYKSEKLHKILILKSGDCTLIHNKELQETNIFKGKVLQKNLIKTFYGKVSLNEIIEWL